MIASEGPRGTVVLTREPPDNDELAAALAAAGFGVLEWPCTATRWLEPEGGAEGLRGRLVAAGLVAFTSRRAVAGALRLLGEEGLAEALAGGRCAAVGPATAAALERAGLAVALTAEGRGWRELGERLLAETGEGDRLLLVRSAAADERLPRTLEARGRVVDDVRLHGPGEPSPVRAEARPLAALVCASPAAARLLLAWNPWAAEQRFVAIGPTTAEALEDELGVARVAVATGTTTADLLAAIEEDCPE